MSDPLYKVVIGFANSNDLFTTLVNEQNAETIGTAAIKQATAYSIAILDWNTGKDSGKRFIVNARNIDYLTMEQYELPS